MVNENPAALSFGTPLGLTEILCDISALPLASTLLLGLGTKLEENSGSPVTSPFEPGIAPFGPSPLTEGALDELPTTLSLAEATPPTVLLAPGKALTLSTETPFSGDALPETLGPPIPVELLEPAEPDTVGLTKPETLTRPLSTGLAADDGDTRVVVGLGKTLALTLADSTTDADAAADPAAPIVELATSENVAETLP
ncbi:hypothetical protein BWQ96_04888 [Gracilariopsis chorda]|uniref:Uncharacterized protein n=1 Tax=Gracilariopsis chorda TaxID=448386 RepID=A0A2V3ITB3_9FLOR|nr:hypothetical protein BWQ96_04888 [Gracilariopsis chorda]|eukprot:PXF45368.1 hypothetical protein BWQ96_04888 [Gracilariopsis chorda]